MIVRSAAWKRYNWRVLWLSLVYAAFLIGAAYGFKHRLVPEAFAYVVALLPALPVIGIFAAIVHLPIVERQVARPAMA